MDMDGKVHIYKARLVAKGCTQTYVVDYEETFSPIADIRSIRILIAIAAYYDHEIWQIDVKTAFLNGFLEKEIYMEQPEGFIDPNHPRKVCFLEKDFILQKESGRIIELQDEDILPSKNTSEHPIEEESIALIVSQEEDVIPIRRSVRTHKAPDQLCLNVDIDPDRL
nr:retrotransposon protein, putative, Ty1-copia subclass [Tanacetum cinerariifolium]